MNKMGYSQSGQLRVAVVGLRWWGKGLFEGLKDGRKIRAVKPIDPLPAGGDWAKQQGLDFTTDYDAVLADPNVGGVVLCTPHSIHAKQAQAAAKAKKHVFCEKPALTRRDAVVVVEACKANGVVLAVGHEHRFKPAMQEVLRMVRSGELGTIQMSEATLTPGVRPWAAANWRLQQREAPAGSMTALGIHGLDICVAINGPAESVFANMRSLVSPTPDTLCVLVSFKNGAGALISSVLGPPFSIRFAVFGDKGWVQVQDKTHPQAPEGWLMIKCMKGGKPQTVEYPGMSMVRANLEAFADAAAGRASYPVTYQEMIDTVAALEAIGISAQSGQIVQVTESEKAPAAARVPVPAE